MIAGGLIVGASEKLAEVYVGAHIGGGIEGWFPYVLAVAFSWRVQPVCSAIASPRGSDHEHSVHSDGSGPSPGPRLRTKRIPVRVAAYLALAVVWVSLPVFANDYVLNAVAVPVLTLALAGIGQNVLTGYAGQLSVGSAAFMSVGAFATFDIHVHVPAMPLLASFALGGGVAATAGVCFGLPSLRIRGFYVVVSTLAAQFFVEWLFTSVGWFRITAPRAW